MIPNIFKNLTGVVVVVVVVVIVVVDVVAKLYALAGISGQN